MMPIAIFLTEIFTSLLLSLCALVLLKNALRAVLTDLCGGVVRAEFWTRFTQLMLLCGPLLGTLFLGRGNFASAVLDVGMLRETLSHALTGAFVTLAGVGFVIWRVIISPVSQAVPRVEA